MENQILSPLNPHPILNDDPHEHQLTQKHSRKIVVIIFLFFLVTGLAALAYFAGTQNRKIVPPTYVTPVPSQIPATTPTTTGIEGWKTFSNFDLSFQYPSDFTELKDNQAFDQSQTAVVSLSSNKANYFAPNYSQESTMVVSSSDDIANCLANPQNGTQSLGEKEFGGNKFTVFSSADAGAGNRYYTTLYRIVKNQKCFEIAGTVHTSSDYNGIDMAAVDASVKSAQDTFDEILPTFKFTN